MESFFRRVSLIVRKNNNKSFDPDGNEQENTEDDNKQQKQFRQLQQRRRSAPDIRRRGTPVDRIPMESDKKVTSFEHINSQNLTAPSSTTNLTRKNYNSTGELSRFNSVN